MVEGDGWRGWPGTSRKKTTSIESLLVRYVCTLGGGQLLARQWPIGHLPTFLVWTQTLPTARHDLSTSIELSFLHAHASVCVGVCVWERGSEESGHLLIHSCRCLCMFDLQVLLLCILFMNFSNYYFDVNFCVIIYNYLLNCLEY